jgi:hypothetical protein
MWHRLGEVALLWPVTWHCGGAHLSGDLCQGGAHLLTWTNGRVPRGTWLLRWLNQGLPRGIGWVRWTNRIVTRGNYLLTWLTLMLPRGTPSLLFCFVFSVLLIPSLHPRLLLSSSCTQSCLDQISALDQLI